MDMLLGIYVIFMHFVIVWPDPPYLTLLSKSTQACFLWWEQTKGEKGIQRVNLAKFLKYSALIFILLQNITAMIAL